MKLAIMQPYFFPYIGYFQLIQAVDAFVVYDDVNYINRGWINRNYVLANDSKTRLTLHLEGASQNTWINQIHIGENKHKLLKTIQHAYAKAPYFDLAFPVISACLLENEVNLAVYLTKGLQTISHYLDIDTQWFISSKIEKNNFLKGQEKILDICKKLDAGQYINMLGGKALYDQTIFAGHDIQLSFIEPAIRPYLQGKSEFVPYLSIIDVMMYNSQARCQQLVREYQIV